MKSFVAIGSVWILLIGLEAVLSVTLNPNIGSNWASPKYHRKTALSRESSVEPTSSGGHPTGSQVYSTLPDHTNVNSFGVAAGSQQVNFVPEANSQNYYNYQVVPADQAQASQDSFNYVQQQGAQPFSFAQQGQPQQDGFFPGGFEITNNEIAESETPGFLSGLMNTLLENTGVGAIFNTMREMFTNLTGGELTGVFSSMRTVAMSMMALPLMLPMAGIPVAMGLLGLMAFPILQLTLPGIRRSFSDTATMTQNVLRSEECVERLSCNLARMTRKIPYEGWFNRLEKSENRWLTRVSKSVKAARTGEDCKKFTCDPVTRVQNIVRSYILGDKEVSVPASKNIGRKDKS